MQRRILQLIAECNASFDGPLIVESLLKNRGLWFAADFTDGWRHEAAIKGGTRLENPQITIFAIHGSEYELFALAQTWQPAQSEWIDESWRKILRLSWH
jgi:hypothetical protein